MQLLQALEPNDKTRLKELAVNTLKQISEDGTFLILVCFSYKQFFHVLGKQNKHNTRI